MFGARFIDAQRPRYSAGRRAPHQVAARPGRGRRRRPPRVQLRLGLRDKPSAHGTLARTPRGDVGAEWFQTPRILASRHPHEHLFDDTPVERVRIRERPHRGQRHLRASGEHAVAESRPFARPTRPDWAHAPPGTPAAPADAHTVAHTLRPDPLPAWPRAPSGPPRPTPGARPGYQSGSRPMGGGAPTGIPIGDARDCARLLLHGGSFAGEACTSGSLTGRIARPARSRRYFNSYWDIPLASVALTQGKVGGLLQRVA